MAHASGKKSRGMGVGDWLPYRDINCRWDGVQNCNIIESVDEHDGGDLQQLCVHMTLENTGSINDLSQLKAFRGVVMYP